MKSNFSTISGFEINNLPFELQWVGDLLFFDWSIISILTDEKGKPFVKAWLETKDLQSRYIVFETPKHLLESYVFGINSYLDVLTNPVNDLMFLIDSDSENNIISTKIVTASCFPNKYLPKKHVLFDQEDTINFQDILETFSLKDMSKNDEGHYTFDILDEASKNNSELINLHLASTNGKVGFGKIQSQILGEILVNYNKMAETAAIDAIEIGNVIVPDSFGRYKKDEVEFVKKLASTEYSYDKAASFSIFLKPIKNVRYEDENKTSTEKIVDRIFRMFNIGTDLTQLAKPENSFSEAMLNAYSSFLRSVRENDLMLTVQYGNPHKNTKKAERFDSRKSDLIIRGLASYDHSAPVENKFIGTFTALDKIKYTFRFLTDENYAFQGKFDKQMFNVVYTFNLFDIYKVGVTTSKERKSGRNEEKASHIITFCYKNNDSKNKITD